MVPLDVFPISPVIREKQADHSGLRDPSTSRGGRALNERYGHVNESNSKSKLMPLY